MTAIKPMLAYSKNPDLSTLEYPVIVQPKFDGIRAMVVDGVLLSRRAKPIRNAEIQAALGRPEFNGLDGELLVGPPTANDAMQRSSEFVMSSSKTGAAWHFYVFDKFDCIGADYTHRRRHAALIVADEQARTGYMSMVGQAHCSGPAAVEVIEAQYVEQGYEGAIIRDPRAPYKHSRSGKYGPLLKMKRWTDAEAIVIGVNEQMTNGNEAKRDAFGRTERSSAKAGLIPAGTLGNLRCRTPEGVEFEIGTGFDAALKQRIWNEHMAHLRHGLAGSAVIGRIVKYKFIPVGVKIAPRFPVFLGFRDADDMS